MRVLIASGGTGGHFYPGLALARELGRRGHETLFLLRKGDPAAPRLDELSLPWTELDLSGLPRRPSPAWLTLPFRTLKAFKTARDIVRAWRPGAVVGMGGYLTLPAAAAARWRGVPVVLHEANAVLGLANRLARPLARTLALGLPLESGGEGTLVGIPVRESLWTACDPEEARAALGLDKALPAVLVVGGSQGARALNALLPEAAPKVGVEFQILHLAGKDGAEQARASYHGGPVKSLVVDYLERMDQAYAAADVAVCRAGASTVAELVAQRLPALLVPYPHATGRHQDANARVLARAGAAELLPEASLTAESLADRLRALLADIPRQKAMAEAYRTLGLPPASEAAKRLADLVVGVRCSVN